MNSKCYFCHIKSFEKLLDKNNVSEDKRQEATKEFFTYLSEIKKETLAPEIAKITNRVICKVLNSNDPYSDLKQESNEILLNKYSDFRQLIDKSSDRFDTAMRLAVAGNIIDSIGSPDADIFETINHVLNSDFAINDSIKLKNEISTAKTILYLGDNAGEIVMDKLFVNTISHSNLYYAVRGNPVINDALMDDAELVGMAEVANVISNGDNAPSTLLNCVSDEFMEIYNKADVVISKGMGNLEGLLYNGNSKIFFLLMVKCDPIGEMINAKKNDFVVMQNIEK